LKIRVITEYYLQGEEIGMVNDRRETTTVNGMAFHAEVSAFAVGEYRQQFQILAGEHHCRLLMRIGRKFTKSIRTVT
jgi:hypothetical protein